MPSDPAWRTTGITDSGGTTTLSYDYEDRLVSISRPGVSTNTFAYNGFGGRVSKTDSSGSNTYLRASSGLIGSIVADSGATYTPGVSEKRGATSTFYHSDIKNTVEQTSTSQTVTASKQYDAFGNEVSSSGSWHGPFQYGGAFGYHTDSDYGLKHLGARYYDPTTGRFLSRDPIRDGRNWYGYANSCPTSYVDEDGLAPIGPPPIPVPGDPNNEWKWNPDPNNSRGGAWGPARPIPGQSQPSASWEPESEHSRGHWDVDDGFGNRQRYDSNGRPRSAAWAHRKTWWDKITKWGRKWGTKVLKGVRNRIPLIGAIVFARDWYESGLDGAVRELLFVDEVEAAGGWIRDQGDGMIERAQDEVEDWYNRRGGLGSDIAEYGLDY